VSETHIIGGQPRAVRVVLDTPPKLSGYGLSPAAVAGQLQAANVRQNVGGFSSGNREFQVEAGQFFSRVEDLQQVVVGVRGSRPVYLRDVAEKIEDGPAEPLHYVFYGAAAGAGKSAAAGDYPAVTITVSKRKGANATILAENVLRRVDEAKGNVIPFGFEHHRNAELRRDSQR